ncbi:MAG: hypothetical protein DLM68_13670 [Hyphomicrobiales bacterium]|nr:MAG: hypothetical protein DLM68_13670 [Hyphomicrobiales bacterium]
MVRLVLWHRQRWRTGDRFIHGAEKPVPQLGSPSASEAVTFATNSKTGIAMAAAALEGWHRHMTLSVQALAALAGLRARLQEAQISIASAKAKY